MKERRWWVVAPPGRSGSARERRVAGGVEREPQGGCPRPLGLRWDRNQRRRERPVRAGDGPPTGVGHPAQGDWAGRACRGPALPDGERGHRRRVSGLPGPGDSPGPASRGGEWPGAPVLSVWEERRQPGAAAGPRDGVVGWSPRMGVKPAGPGRPEREKAAAPWRVPPPQRWRTVRRALGGRGPAAKCLALPSGREPGAGRAPGASAPAGGAMDRSPPDGTGPEPARAAPAGEAGAKPPERGTVRGADRSWRPQVLRPPPPSSPTGSPWREAGARRSPDP